MQRERVAGVGGWTGWTWQSVENLNNLYIQIKGDMFRVLSNCRIPTAVSSTHTHIYNHIYIYIYIFIYLYIYIQQNGLVNVRYFGSGLELGIAMFPSTGATFSCLSSGTTLHSVLNIQFLNLYSIDKPFFWT